MEALETRGKSPTNGISSCRISSSRVSTSFCRNIGQTNCEQAALVNEILNTRINCSSAVSDLKVSVENNDREKYLGGMDVLASYRTQDWLPLLS